MRRIIRRLLLEFLALFALLTALLTYTFLPRRLDPALVPEPAVWVTGVEPRSLPPTTLSLIRTGKMPSRELFAWRGGRAGAPYENGMAAALIRHPQGMVLFDTGFGARVDEHWLTIPRLMRSLSSYVKEPPAVEQLKANGIDPSSLRMAIISHSHWDHISGLVDFPGLEVWMPSAELEFIRAGHYPGLIDTMIDQLKVRTFDYTGGPYENFDRSLDLFNDGAVVLVPLPGHTLGSCGMFVNLPSGRRFLLTGDLTWAREGFELPAERPWLARRLVDYDEAEVRRSILRVHQLMRRYPDLVIVPAHDRRVHDRIAAFPEVER